MQWFAFWFCDTHVAVSNPVGDSHGNMLFGEVALKNRRSTSSLDRYVRGDLVEPPAVNVSNPLTLCVSCLPVK